MAYSQPKRKNFFFKLIRLLFSYLAWAFGIGLACSRCWRVWEFNSNTVPVVFIGLWEVFFFQILNVSGLITEVPTYYKINESWIISDEIWYGQDLILLANFMKSIVLIFGTLALFISWINGPYPDFLRSCYNISAFFLFLSFCCTIITVSWNFTVDFYGETTLDFPLSFPIEKAMLKKKHISYVFPLGIITATISLISATTFFFEACSLKHWNRVKPRAVAKCSKEKV